MRGDKPVLNKPKLEGDAMKRAILTVVMAVMAISAPAWADEWKVNFSLGAGLRTMNSGWGDATSQNSVDVKFDFRKVSWPVNILLAYSQGSSNNDFTCIDNFGSSVFCKLGLSEVDLGVIKYFEGGGSFVPYVSAGLGSSSFQVTTSSASSVTSGQTSTGLFLDGGVLLKFTANWRAGLDVKMLTGTGSMLPGLNANYIQYGLFLGFGF